MASEYLYTLKLIPRLWIASHWTEEDNAIVGRHSQKLQDAKEEGILILAGRTQTLDETTFGIVIFKAQEEASAEAFMRADPAVAEGIMTAVLYPYKVALICEENRV